MRRMRRPDPRPPEAEGAAWVLHRSGVPGGEVLAVGRMWPAVRAASVDVGASQPRNWDGDSDHLPHSRKHWPANRSTVRRTGGPTTNPSSCAQVFLIGAGMKLTPAALAGVLALADSDVVDAGAHALSAWATCFAW